MNYNDLLEYVKRELEGCDAHISIALDNMDKYRCPLDNACDYIVDRIESAISDYCSDNDIDEFDTYEVFGKDIEDIFFDAIG